ncbi:GNAT family N-acetyltransferase [Shewanella sp. AS16]|uniref:GNAT family N-acetyltransferase n=1 Tax=Shewanella sp. AS16 TaxID=2907625 RepID=UPI001F192046|nr:GNAT family N-acetyltransferase [Shewanella sp. AS16]MCE9686449.1 GNAT family N-acetyltransferase [Shewanella sp. AS16]
MLLRTIAPSDWEAIVKIQDECYSQLAPESLAVLQSKWRVAPESCFVIQAGQTLVGYCLAHPWAGGTPPPLYHCIDKLPQAETLYLHDMAISADAQGLGAGRQALTRLKQRARELGLTSLSLVAVQGAAGYWQKMGFRAKPLAKSLDSYTQDACYMVMILDDDA